MKEGPVEYFKFRQIIQSKDDGLFYTYFGHNEINCSSSLLEAKHWIIRDLCDIDLKTLEHPGVRVQTYEHNELTYVISVESHITDKFPRFFSRDYAFLAYNTSRWVQYLHNEKGPSNICIEGKQKHYYWHGKLLEKQDWEKAIHDMNFNNKLDDLIKD